MQRFAPSRSLSLCPTSPPYHKTYTQVLYKCVIRVYNSRGEQECGKEVRGEPIAKGTCREGAGWVPRAARRNISMRKWARLGLAAVGVLGALAAGAKVGTMTSVPVMEVERETTATREQIWELWAAVP